MKSRYKTAHYKEVLDDISDGPPSTMISFLAILSLQVMCPFLPECLRENIPRYKCIAKPGDGKSRRGNLPPRFAI